MITKLTVFFVRSIGWATIRNVITPKRLCNAVFTFTAEKLILAVGICAYFGPRGPKSFLSNCFVSQYEAKMKEGKKENRPIRY